MNSPEVHVPAPLVTWNVPVVRGGAIEIQALPGDVTTIVGANGAGKSALATWFAAHAPQGTLTRVVAQRKLWFEHSGPSITPASREQYGAQVESWDRQERSRYYDRADAQRSSVILFDLLGHINDENRIVAELFENGASREEVQAAIGPRLMPRMNAILERSGLHVELGVTTEQTFVAKHRKLAVEYPIVQMSDGERSAVLLAAEVLVAPAGVIMIDEPERHLHRSISAGLVDAIVASRPDCAFVVLTHDLDLAVALNGRPGTAFAVTGVTWGARNPEAWELHEIPPAGELPQVAKRAILGGRKTMLFIEGEAASVDSGLYSVLYEGVTLAPAGNCELVLRAVAGLRDSADHHWLDVHGIVDGDGRSDEERAALAERGVFALQVHEVENLYYLPVVMAAVAGRQAGTLGGEVDELVGVAIDAALREVGRSGVLERIASKLARDAVARELLAHMPAAVGPDDIEVSFPSPYERIRGSLTELLTRRDFGGLVRVAPIRDTGVRTAIANHLGFRSVGDYQAAALVRIIESPDLRAALRSEVGALDLQ